MDVITPEQARIAEDAGAVAVMALERVPADIRADGGVARMSDPEMIKGIQETVTIPVMAKARIGHFAEAQILQSLEVDYIDESEVLTPADEANHIDKQSFEVPFVCGATNLGEALRRIAEGAAMIRSKGEAGTGNIVEAVRHLRGIVGGIRPARRARLARSCRPPPRSCGAPLEVVAEVAESRLAAGAALLRGRHRHSGRRGADDAARGRGQHSSAQASSSRRSPSAAPARSSRPRRTSTTRSASRPRRWGSGSRCAATTSPSSPPRASCSSTAGPEPGGRPPLFPEAGGSPIRVGVLASQGDFAAHARDAPRARRRGRSRCERRERVLGARRAGHPRRGVDDDHEGDRARRAGRGDPRARRAPGGADARDLRRA